MPDYILVQDVNNKWQRAGEQDLPDETILQRLIRENPEVLPLGDLGDNVPPLLIVGRETALLNGYVDVIGVDEDGLITLIECKLDRNPEVKRTVIGQILGYGAYLWGMSYAQFEADVARKYLDSPQCHRSDWRGLPLDEAMERFRDEHALGGEWDRDTFRQRLEENLKAGRLRLVIVVDKVNDELRRTVEYLNACTGPNFELLCAELRYFATEHARLLVPALIGAPPSKRQREQAQRTGQRWDAPRLFADIEKRHGAEIEQLARRIHAWAEQLFEIGWGSGIANGSMIPYVRWSNERFAVPFVVYSSGHVEIAFQYLKTYPPFEPQERRQALLQRLNAIPGVNLPADSYNRRPSFKLPVLTDPAAYAAFTKVMAEVRNELQQAREQTG